jgi:predicted HTH domain antitoxin
LHSRIKQESWIPSFQCFVIVEKSGRKPCVLDGGNMNSTITFECPPELLLGLHYDTKEFAHLVQFETAISLFSHGKISSGMAARWLGLPRVQFLAKSWERGIDLLDNSEDDLRRETQNL